MYHALGAGAAGPAVDQYVGAFPRERDRDRAADTGVPPVMTAVLPVSLPLPS